MNIQHMHLCFSVEFLSDEPDSGKKGQEQLTKWMLHLISSIGMKIVLPPRFFYINTKGNDGWTGSCNIETSHMAIHIWDHPYA
jgi:S-adenosylmethionine/arginine decarboxylase-like enzyme